MNTTEIKAKIKEEMLQSGYPLEIFCKKKLLNLGWAVTSTKFYKTNQENYREIDAEAFKYSETKKNLSFHSSITIECKKMTGKHWVFFDDSGHPMPNLTSNVLNKEELFLKFTGKRGKINNHHYNYIADYATNYFIAHCKPGSPESRTIYDASVKLIEFHKQTIAHQETITSKFFQIHHLVIVFDGLLFLSDFKNNEINMALKNHIIVPVCQREENFKYQYYSIDIISKTYFEKFIKILDQDHEYFRDTIKTIQIKEKRGDSNLADKIRKLRGNTNSGDTRRN